LSGAKKMTVPAQNASGIDERSIEVDGLRIRFLHGGHGAALVLVHGLLGYSSNWRSAIPILAEDREVFAPDMPGAGFSDSPHGLDGRLVAATGRLSRFLDSVGVARCDLVGSSYGGATALRLAALEPSRVRSLILVSPANPWSHIGRRRLAALGVPGVGLLFPSVSRRARFLHGYFVRRMYGDPARVTAETLRSYSLPLGRRGVFEHAVRIAQNWRSDMNELRREMPKAADVPTLVLWGSKDRLVDIGSARQIAANFRVSETRVIEGAGHLPYEEVPEEFCKPVLEFLKIHSPAQVLDGK
jgi:pimeloyl-ACP methyl ester carboxylesterase